MNIEERGDLIALVADKNMKFAVEGLLKRTKSIGIRPSHRMFFHI